MDEKPSNLQVTLVTLFWASLVLGFMGIRFAGAHPPIEEKIAALTRRIEQNPGDATLYLNRGQLYRTHQEWSFALADFKRAAELDPSLVEVDLHLGSLFFAIDQPENAQVLLKRFLAQRPDHAGARVIYARIWLKLGNRRRAVEEYTQAIGLHSNPAPELYYERAKALAEEGDAQVDEALQGLDEGLQQLGPVVALQLYAIDLELKKNRFDAAIARLEQIAAQSPRKEVWFLRRGEILEKAGRYREAHEAFSAALAAVQKLSEHRRRTRAIMQLEARIQDALDRLSSAAQSPQEKGDQR